MHSATKSISRQTDIYKLWDVSQLINISLAADTLRCTMHNYIYKLWTYIFETVLMLTWMAAWYINLVYTYKTILTILVGDIFVYYTDCKNKRSSRSNYDMPTQNRHKYMIKSEIIHGSLGYQSDWLIFF